MKKTIEFVLAAIMVLFCFAGCASSQQPATNDDQPAADNNQPAEQVITVGYTIYEPMNYKDESGKLVGYDTELAEKVFGNLGYKVIFKEIDWASKYTDLNSGTIDCVWNGFTCNTPDDDGIARSEKVDFSYNYMENRQVIVAKKGSGIAAAADLQGKMAAAEAGSAGQTYAEGFEGASVKTFPYQTDCLMEVNAGTADFAVLDAQLAKSYCGKGDYAELEIIDSLSSDVEYYAIGFKKNSELTAKVNEQLEKLGAEGFIATLAEKYGVASTAITDFADQK